MIALIIPTVRLPSTKFLTLWQHFYPKGWRGRTIRLSSVINNTAMYDAEPPLFFQLFQSETAATKCKKVGLYGKNTSKILAIIFDKEDKVRFLSEFFYTGLWLAEHCVKRFSGASEQIKGVKINPPDCWRFIIQTHLFALCNSSFTLKIWKNKKWACSVIHRSIVYAAAWSDWATAPSFWVKQLL